jgi:hypothetical protein
MNKKNERSCGSLGVGVVLITLGVFLLAGQLGYVPMSYVLQFWPLIVIGLGFAKIVQPRIDGEDRWSGFWLVIAGLYCLVSQWRLFGLHWGNSWPLMIIAGGAMTIVKTLARQNRPTSNGDRHE